jgi:TRAP-type C4-dicarboxylate transport system substrate-binding protein
MVKRKALLRSSATVSLTLFLLCILLIDPGPVAARKKPRYTWRLGSAWTQPVRNESIQLFCDLVNVYSKGKIRLRFQPRGLLGGHDEIFHGVQEGSVEMGVFAPYVNLVPGGMLNWMPWTVGTYDEAAVAYSAPEGIKIQMRGK